MLKPAQRHPSTTRRGQAPSFDRAFADIMGVPPLRWQHRLYHRMLNGDIPPACHLPTGMGKTAVTLVWLLALASQADRGRITLPRRLVYIVHRRTVVDQVTTLCENIRAALLAPPTDTTGAVARALRELVSTGNPDVPVAVSTLRGALADNREWVTDPSRAAIIVGTVDMVGSRLLFSGYGDGRRQRPLHAGLLGQDSLIVLDEAHLTPVFARLLQTIARIQRESGDPRPIRVMELTATPTEQSHAFHLEPEDEKDTFVAERLNARKILRIHTCDDKDLPRRAAAIAASEVPGPSRVLIFMRSPEHAADVARVLSGKHRIPAGRVVTLTGTMRGYERDRLVLENTTFRTFLRPDATPDRSVYLVCTAAGEVGTDIYGDHTVMDPTTFESLVQRLGRCNRQGGRDKTAHVHLVVPSSTLTDIQPDREEGKKKTDSDRLHSAIRETVRILQRHEGESLSPRQLASLARGMDPRTLLDCRAPQPEAPDLSPADLELLSLTGTTTDIPGRHETHHLLHGYEQDPPETSVCWRTEVTHLANHDVPGNDVSRWFSRCGILPHEVLRDRTDRVVEALKELLKRHRRRSKDPEHDFSVIVLGPDGEARLPRREDGTPRHARLSDISSERISVRHCTVVLPPEAGGLSTAGMLTPSVTKPARDVAEEHHPREPGAGTPRTRWLVIRDPDGTERWEPLHATTDRAGDPDSPPTTPPRGSTVTCTVELSEDRLLVLCEQPPETRSGRKEKQYLTDHTSLVVQRCDLISARLGLDRETARALRAAAAMHDLGKDHPLWQYYACADTQDPPLARSSRYRHPRVLAGYRHELGSLLQATREQDRLPDATRDLCLHLVASHHGRARPHFDQHACDNRATLKDNHTACTEAARRFVRMQRRHGLWGLAWMEALFRCADAATDGEPGDDP